MTVSLGDGVTKRIPAAIVPRLVSKLLGVYYLEDALTIDDDSSQEVMHGLSHFKPLKLGQDVGPVIWKAGLAEDYYFKARGEAVALRRNDGRTTVGRVMAISAEHVVVAVGDGLIKDIATSHVPDCLGKLIGSYYLGELRTWSAEEAHTDYCESTDQAGSIASVSPLMEPEPRPESKPPEVLPRKLIISTGDISDVDGFFALAEYAKTGADVLFIMNYPAYIGIADSDVDETFADKHPGLGYKRSAKQVLANVPTPAPEAYTDFMSSYEGQSDNARMQGAMTDLAYSMARRVWEEVPGDKGRLLFRIGGINAVSTFSASAIKNEVLVYSKLISKPDVVLPPLEGVVYDSSGAACSVDWGQFADIYIDFNGSMAFWSEGWQDSMSAAGVAGKVRGAFVMGGVLADRPPVTMPSIANVLNRFSCATLNQLYHPQRTADFFTFLRQHSIETFTVTNNAVCELATFADAERKVKTYEGVERFLSANGLDGHFLRELAAAYYNSQYAPQRQPIDYYTAVLLRSVLNAPAMAPRSAPLTLLYSNQYGVALVSEAEEWAAALKAYRRGIDTEAAADDPPFVRAKKDNFRRELEALGGASFMPGMTVLDVAFRLDPATHALSIATA